MEFKLQYVNYAQDVWVALGQIPVAEWLKIRVDNPETAREQAISSRELIINMREKLKEFTIFDILEILNMLEVSNYPKCITGDRVIVSRYGVDKEKLLAMKFGFDFKAMQKIRKGLGKADGEIFDHWLNFETGDNDNAILARQAKKCQQIEKAFEYQKSGENLIAKEFLDYYRDDIIHPVLKKMIAEIEEKIKAL